MAKALAHKLDAGWLQLDSIWLAMKAAAAGRAARDVLDIDRRMRRAHEADEDVLAAHVAASREVCRALPTVLEFALETAHARARPAGRRGVAVRVLAESRSGCAALALKDPNAEKI